jgi:hypothetical protein
MKLAPIADRVAESLAAQQNTALDWDAIREHCDMASGGDLDCYPLDLLTDMVAARIGVAA